MRSDGTDCSDGTALHETALQLLEGYHEALNDHDIEAVLGFIHSESPAQEPTRQVLHQLFSSYRLRNELVDASYVGSDGGYEFIRIVQKISKLAGPEFKDNIPGSLVALRMEGNVLKVWSMMMLEVNFSEHAA